MMNYADRLKELLRTTVELGASDLHLGVGRNPTVRVAGSLIPLSKEDVLTAESAEGLVNALLNDDQKQRLLKTRQLDLAVTLDNVARFRTNVYFQSGYYSAALRMIHGKIRTIESLNLPAKLHDFTKLTQGMILAVGPAGHGKSTTLAALVDEINHTRTDHIITVEDPIEYLFAQNKCMIAQREVGSDVLSFNDGLRTVLRQDPDVIMIGEMRDTVSIGTAMTAAETGHLVFSTLHTNSAVQTIDRIIDSFPPEGQGQATSQLSGSLVAILSQRLLPRISGGLIPAMEVMIVNTAIRNLIRERKAFQIDHVMETHAHEGMITLNHSLASLVRKGDVAGDTALMYSLNPTELKSILSR